MKQPKNIALLTTLLSLAALACGNADVTPSSSSSSSSASSGGMGGEGGNGGATGGGGESATAPSWVATASMGTPRMRHTATRLADGRVLVVGGEDASGNTVSSSEIFDPGTETWSDGPQLTAARQNHTAVLLSDGRVAIIGGGSSTSNGVPAGADVTGTVEVFDPATDTVSAGPPLQHARGHHRAVRLDDGRVLVVGGVAEGATAVLPAEMLAADGSAWVETGAITTGRALFGAVRDASGDVVIAGGIGSSLLRSAERFDPASGTWSTLPQMMSPRMYVALAPLAEGGVVAMGGIGGPNDFLASTEWLDAEGKGWTAGSSVPGDEGDVAGGTGLSIVMLEDGDALVVGGYGIGIKGYGAGDFSGILNTTSLKWRQTSRLDQVRGSCGAVQLEDGRVLLAGGIGASGGPTESSSITEAPVE